MAGREWGFWTREKLDILRRYLDGFTTASSRLDEIVYLDLFSGEPQNYDRVTGARVAGSPRIALEADDPRFTKLRFFELDANALALEDALRAEFPDRDFIVYPGDCNATVSGALADLADVAWAPTFAFIDPNGPDVTWSTLESLAAHKVRSRYKVELWMLFPVGMFMRNLPHKGAPRAADVQQLDRAYGSTHWQLIYELYQRGRIDGAQAREEYVNLMRWRLENTLQYRWTHAFDVRNESGTSMYHLVFATDNEAGNRIMSHLYGLAAEEFPAMREQTRRLRKKLRDEASGKMQLFDAGTLEALEELVKSDDLYQHEPPWHPPGTESDGDQDRPL